MAAVVVVVVVGESTAGGVAAPAIAGHAPVFVRPSAAGFGCCPTEISPSWPAGPNIRQPSPPPLWPFLAPSATNRPPVSGIADPSGVVAQLPLSYALPPPTRPHCPALRPLLKPFLPAK